MLISRIAEFYLAEVALDEGTRVLATFEPSEHSLLMTDRIRSVKLTPTDPGRSTALPASNRAGEIGGVPVPVVNHGEKLGGGVHRNLV